METENNNENIIAVYNNMCHKLDLISQHHNNLFIFTLTCSGAIMTYAFQQNNSYIALVNMIILIILRCRVMIYRDEYFQILTFTRVILEPSLNIDTSKLKKLKSTYIGNIQYFVYSLVGGGTIAECIIIKTNILSIILSVVFFFIILLLDGYYLFKSKDVREKYEKLLKED